MEAEDLSEMKSMIMLSRKRELNFALCLGKSLEDTGLLFHRIKPAETLLRRAKRLKGVTPAKYTLGTARSKGRKLTFTCAEEPPPGTALKLRRFFLGQDMPLKVILVDPTGEVVEEDGDDDEVVAAKGSVTDALRDAAGGAKPEDGANRAIGRWKKARRLVGPKIVEFSQSTAPEAAGVGQSWSRALKLGDKGGDPAGAYRMLTRIVDRIKAANANNSGDKADTDRMNAFKTEARKVRQSIQKGEADHLRPVLVEAVKLAHKGDPNGGLELLKKSKRKR